MGDPGVAKSQLLPSSRTISSRKIRYWRGSLWSRTHCSSGKGCIRRWPIRTRGRGPPTIRPRGWPPSMSSTRFHTDDKRMMHPAMEQQKVHVAKGGITATLNSRCSILAAANPKEGRFTKRHKNTSVMRSFKETGLPPPLASRFDIIWMIRDEVRIHDDERIARHILDNRTTGKERGTVGEYDRTGSIR